MKFTEKKKKLNWIETIISSLDPLQMLQKKFDLGLDYFFFQRKMHSRDISLWNTGEREKKPHRLLMSMQIFFNS